MELWFKWFCMSCSAWSWSLSRICCCRGKICSLSEELQPSQELDPSIWEIEGSVFCSVALSGCSCHNRSLYQVIHMIYAQTRLQKNRQKTGTTSFLWMDSLDVSNPNYGQMMTFSHSRTAQAIRSLQGTPYTLQHTIPWGMVGVNLKTWSSEETTVLTLNWQWW